MRTVVRKWGDSASVRIPVSVMIESGLKVGQEVDVRADNGRVIVESVFGDEYELETLTSGISDLNRNIPVFPSVDMRERFEDDVMNYIPDAGDVISIGNDGSGPQLCVVVVSPFVYNKFGFVVCCRVVSEVIGYPFEVVIGVEKRDAALSDQICSFDLRLMDFSVRYRVSAKELWDIRAKMRALIRG